MKTCAGNGYPICEVQVICWTFGVPGNVILNPSSRETNSVQSSCANADPASARTHAVATRTVTRIVLPHLTVSGRDYMRTGRAGPLLLFRGSVVRWFVVRWFVVRWFEVPWFEVRVSVCVVVGVRTRS